jgi:hypothetical protein
MTNARRFGRILRENRISSAKIKRETSQTSTVKCRQKIVDKKMSKIKCRPKKNVDNVKSRHYEIQRKEADDEKIKFEHEGVGVGEGDERVGEGDERVGGCISL